MSQNMNAQSQLVAQWITSLAISVICCAILFVVFASYMVDLHKTINLATVRLEITKEKLTQAQSDIASLRRLVVMHGAQLQQQTQSAASQPAMEQPAASGVEIPDPAPPEPAAGEQQDKVLDNLPPPAKADKQPAAVKK